MVAGHSAIYCLWKNCENTGPHLNIETAFVGVKYEYFHYIDKTVVRPSYLYNGNHFTDKKTSYIEMIPVLKSIPLISQGMDILWMR